MPISAANTSPAVTTVRTYDCVELHHRSPMAPPDNCRQKLFTIISFCRGKFHSPQAGSAFPSLRWWEQSGTRSKRNSRCLRVDDLGASDQEWVNQRSPAALPVDQMPVPGNRYVDYELYYWSYHPRSVRARGSAYAARLGAEGGDGAIARLMAGPVKDMRSRSWPAYADRQESGFRHCRNAGDYPLSGRDTGSHAATPALRALTMKIVNDAK